MSYTAENIMDLRAIPDLLDKNYYIPQYQRGYRWERKQILDLLNDLYAYFHGEIKGQFYCLQPIVVKEIKIDGVRWYEVIDGQQRLTTLRIIMQILDQLSRGPFDTTYRKHSYNILYATRPEMMDIFDSITLIVDNEKVIVDESKNLWRNYIDSRYIYNAADTVLKWFQDNEKHKQDFSHFYDEKIKENSNKQVVVRSDNTGKPVQVVWYETKEVKDPHDIFNRMNSLKVELSCSELIRSLFLSSETYFDLGDLSGISDSLQIEIKKERFGHRQTSINEKWDELEQRMRDREFQSFLTRRGETGRNAIGLLFDLISGKYSNISNSTFSQLNKEDSLYTYLYFKAMIEKDHDAWTTWEKVLNAFEKLQMWYHDRDLYHRIGFLNAVANKGCEDNAICELLEMKEGKNALQDKAISLIKDVMKLPRKADRKSDITSLEELSYDNTTHYDYIKRLLLLYNVETCRKQKRGDAFSFRRFRYLDDNKTERIWTLEHIHAQNSDCLPENNKDSWLDWICVNLEALKKISLGNAELIKEQANLIEMLSNDSDTKGGQCEPPCKGKDYGPEQIKALFEAVVDFYAKLDYKSDFAEPVHQLSNMALLELGPNAMIGKSAFEVKRQRICKEIAEDQYFPICTRKVFLKLYDKETLQVHSWSHRDRKLYYDDLRNKLSIYIDSTAF